MSISCNLIVLISDERGPETERQENVPPPPFFRRPFLLTNVVKSYICD
jgi:hypothetical protein